MARCGGRAATAIAIAASRGEVKLKPTRRLKRHQARGLRMRDCERVGVQHQSVGHLQDAFGCVQVLAEDRVADSLEVQAQLVRAAGDRLQAPAATGQAFPLFRDLSSLKGDKR